ncbi:MAG: D-alanine--D-alanine ligase [Planctomycetota bacterium]
MSNPAPSPRKRPRVVVLMGGPDAEREVSLMSGAQVVAALEAEGGFEVVAQTIFRTDEGALLALEPDCIYPILHGPWGEGGPLQEILEGLERTHGIAFTGPRARPAALAMDKIATKSIATSVGVRTPRARQVLAGEPLDLSAPLVLKPSNDGSSVDLRICHSDSDAEAARAELELRRDRLMAEEFVKGREMTVGIVDGEVLPIIEIVPKSAFYDYESKYISDETRYIVDPDVHGTVADEMRESTRRVFAALGLRDVARADFIVDDRGAWFLEINTAPGMTTHSLVPMASRHRGVDMPALCAGLVRAAIARTASARNPRASTAPSDPAHA